MTGELGVDQVPCDAVRIGARGSRNSECQLREMPSLVTVENFKAFSAWGSGCHFSCFHARIQATTVDPQHVTNLGLGTGLIGIRLA
jgi:hypothetical protein